MTYRDSLLDDPTNNRRLLVTGPEGVKLATEAAAETSHRVSASGHATGEIKINISSKEHHRIATWNVRGLLAPGKLEIMEKEAESHKLTLLGITETHIRGQGYQKTSNGNTLYFSGPTDSSINGVALWLPRCINNYVLGFNPINDRLMTLKLNTHPCTLNIVVVYAPTTAAKDEVIDKFYAVLESTLQNTESRDNGYDRRLECKSGQHYTG